MKTHPTSIKTHRSPQRSRALGSYLSLTVGAGAATLLNANGAIVFYNGPAVTANPNGSWLYWDPVNMTAGLEGASAQNKFNLCNFRPYSVYTKRRNLSFNTYCLVGAAEGVSVNAVAKLSDGATIDASTSWAIGTAVSYLDWSGWTTAESPWATGLDGTRGYIPFQFYSPGTPSDKYYGWADITYNDGALGTVVLNNFAYNNTPNEAITTGGGPAPVPEPATVVSGILLLAMGGAKVLVARRRRNGKQTAETVA